MPAKRAHYTLVCRYKGCERIIYSTRPTRTHPVESYRETRYGVCSICRIQPPRMQERAA